MFWCITMKRHQDNNSGHLWDHESTPNHHCEWLLIGWEWVQVQYSKRMETMRRQGKQKKAQEMSFDISWAIGKFFSSHFIFCY